jgi:FkbM family methyltransferase
MELLKYIAAKLPRRYHHELKRLYFARLIRKRLFQRAIEDDPEFNRLDQWVHAGDWVMDVGANVGNYAARLSELVQASGRVLAFEPVPETFELLAANVRCFPVGNVTLFNVAASDRFDVKGMRIPSLDTGGSNLYMAHLTDGSAEMSVLTMPLDSLDIPRQIRLIKIDVEGHELAAVHGMRRLLERDRPVLIIEGRSPEVAAVLAGLGYSFEQDAGSPNRVFKQVPDRSPVTVSSSAPQS